MAWLARSFVNSLKVDDDDDDKDGIDDRKRESPKDKEEEEEEAEAAQHHQIETSEPQGRGVKEDLSMLTKTLTRQIWGVASFLAPPPSSEPSSPSPPSPPPRQVSSPDPSISDWNRSESSEQSVSGEISSPEISDSSGIIGIRNDFAEIGGKFKTGISRLSNNKAVSEISKIASTFLPPFMSETEFNEEHSVGGAVGVTDEVLTFARNIAMHPETWLDFPLDDDEDSDAYYLNPQYQYYHNIGLDPILLDALQKVIAKLEPDPSRQADALAEIKYFRDPIGSFLQGAAKAGRKKTAADFDMSDAQQEHALAVERLAPRLAALRIELCPGHMSEGCFWKIYFVLLHSRLNKHDAELLSTPQIVEARATLMQELQNQTKPERDQSGRGTSYRRETPDSLQEDCVSASSNTYSETMAVKTFAVDHTTSIPVAELETEKHPVISTGGQIVDKSVIEEEPAIRTQDSLVGASSKVLDQNFEDDGDDWLEEDNSELGGISGTTIPLGNEEDVSFSDLEDDDGSVPMSSKTDRKDS